MRHRRGAVLTAVAALACAIPVVTRAATPSCGWTMFGHDASHTFEAAPGCSSLTAANAATLAPRWFFPTNDSVSASPAVDADTLYVGAWDGTFYALRREDGAPRWTLDVNAHDGNRSAFGRIVSSAALHDVAGTAVVVFGGGATVFVVRASDGHVLASQDLDPNPADGDHVAEVESSPVVVDRNGETVIYVGLDVHNDRDVGRTGVVKLSLTRDATDSWTLHPVWKFDPETAQTYGGVAGLTAGAGTGFGCGGVWSSPAYLGDIVVFGTSSCSEADAAKQANENFIESVFAIDAQTGALRWVFHPSSDPHDASADFDFGASPNVFRTATGGPLRVGNGRKSGEYYAFDAATGTKLWQTTAATPGYTSDGFAFGGFIGTPAVKTAGGVAEAIIGATAIPTPLTWSQDDPAGQLDRATWVARAVDPRTGAIRWQYRLGGPSYGHTAVANDVALVPETFDFRLTVLDVRTGVPRVTIPLAGPPSSTPVPVGTDVYLGVGTRTTDVEWKAFGDGLADAFSTTPLGASPLSRLSGVYAFAVGGASP